MDVWIARCDGILLILPIDVIPYANFLGIGTCSAHVKEKSHFYNSINSPKHDNQAKSDFSYYTRNISSGMTESLS